MTADRATAGIAVPERKAKVPLYRQLYVLVLVALVVGVVLGIADPGLAAQMKPLGDAFIKLIRMLIAPIIFCSVVHGISSMQDMRKVGRVALKALIYFEVITTIALVLSLAFVDLWRPGAGTNLDPATLDAGSIAQYTAGAKQLGAVEFLMHVIPATVVGAFAEGDILQVLFFAVLFAFALSLLGDRGKPLIELIDVTMQTLFRVVGFVMWTAPIAAFGAMAFTVGAFGTATLLSLAALLIEFYVVCLVFIFGVLGVVAWLAGFSIVRLMIYLKDELLIVLATTSSETVLPRLMTKLRDAGCEESVVGLVVPTGYSFNLDGTCLYLTTAAIFLAQATNTELSLGQQLGLVLVLLLTSKGAAGIAGAAFVVLAATLATLGTIPVASIALILGIHRFMSMALTFTNVVGNGVATIVVARWEGALDETSLQQALRGRAQNYVITT